MPGKIPDRWEEYTPLGKPISGTRFITFKVPLEERIVASLPEDDQFTPAKLIEMTKDLGRELGLVIDLTNTKRYYSNKAITEQNIEYHKVFTEGHVVPSSKVRNRFFTVIDKYLQDDTTEDKLIGVHCTHGVNRTGYLVCRYMIDKLGFQPDDALKAYGDARGYPIERENYIEDLKTKKYDPNEVVEEDEEEDTPDQTDDSNTNTCGIPVISRRNDGRGDQNRNRRHDSSWNNHRPRDNWGQQSYSNRYQNDRSSYGHSGRDRDGGGYQQRTRRYEDQGRSGRDDGRQDRGFGRRRNWEGQRGHNNWSQSNRQREPYQNNSRYRDGQRQDYQGDRYGQRRDYQGDRYGGQRQDYQGDRYQNRQGQNHQQNWHQGGDYNHYNQNNRYSQDPNRSAYQRAGWS